MKIGIVLDSWKLPIFTKILAKAGFKYDQFDGPGAEVITLTVQTENADRLQSFVKKANDKAARNKLH